MAVVISSAFAGKDYKFSLLLFSYFSVNVFFYSHLRIKFVFFGLGFATGFY